MSKIILFYAKDESKIFTTVHGHAFSFLEKLFHTEKLDIYKIIDQGHENNGYHYNSVTNEYEFWSSQKTCETINMSNFDVLKKEYDGVFEVNLDAEKTILQLM